jgi:hypothetical protein
MEVKMRREQHREEQYFKELAQLVGVFCEGKQYTRLLYILWNKDFYVLLREDENRVIDGYELRRTFGFEDISGPSNCLEVLIAVANRCVFELDASRYQSTVGKMFWELVNNLGLLAYSDDLLNAKYSGRLCQKIDGVLDKWVRRAYLFNGTGGIFPLKSSRIDQRNVELWYQMQAYLIEKT